MKDIEKEITDLIEKMPPIASGFSRTDSMEIFERLCKIREMAQAEREEGVSASHLAEYNAELRWHGLKLAGAATYVIRNYDGLHRLAKAAASFVDVVANEGGRGCSGDQTGDVAAGRTD